MSNISLNHQARAFAPPLPLFVQAPDVNPAPDTAVRAKRSLALQPPVAPNFPWTLPALSLPSAGASSAADGLLQTSLGGSALRRVADAKVPIPADTTIFPLYDAYQRAFNTPELQAWFLGKGMALSTVVVSPESVSGRITRDGVSTVHTFTTLDGSGWWQASTRLRAAAQGLDPEGMGLPYPSEGSNAFSRNAILRWYGVQPPSSDGDLDRVRHELSMADWSAPPPEKKSALQSRVQTVRSAISNLDERAHLASFLSQRIENKSDDETVTLDGLEIQVSRTSTLARSVADMAPLGDVLKSHGLPLPKTGGELRNVVRWLNAALPPAPALGNYAQLISTQWTPGALSDADKRFLVQLSDEDADSDEPSFDVLRMLDDSGVLDKHTPEILRAQADGFLDTILGTRVAKQWGTLIARQRAFLSASGSDQPSALEIKQWVLAAIMLKVDPNAPARPGTLAGYDLYQAGNSGRPLAALRSDIEAHLLKNTRLDAKTAPLVAHLFLASAAPEFLVRDIPPTLSMGSMEWSDLRLGVAMAERQGGKGCSRGMSYQEIMALSRLDSPTTEGAAVLANYAADVLLDWGMMQGLYAKPADGRYAPEQYQQAGDAFAAQREQLLDAVTVFKTPMPTRKALATANLQKVFPDLDVQQLHALRVYIADPNERRNMKPSEPRTRSLVETYMTGELTENRWMLLTPGQQPPQPAKAKTPFGKAPGLGKADQAAVDTNVQALDTKIANLPDVQGLLPGEVDTYLDQLKQGLSITTRRMIANLPLADRQALERGNVELFALREQIDRVPTLEQTPGQVEERRGRKGTLIRSEYEGVVRYFEVFPDKLMIIKRDNLPNQLALGGTFEDHQKTYGRWAPTTTQLQNGAVEPFDFNAYSSDAAPRPNATSPGIIIEKIGDTLAAESSAAPTEAGTFVPNSFSSARTLSIVDRIMQGNFAHHRDTVLKIARDELPLEQKREVSRRNDAILLGMIPFVGAFIELFNGNIVAGTRGLIVDTFGALLGGAGATLGPLVKSTKMVAPFGAKAFRVLEKGVAVVSSFLNPLDGAADLLINGSKGLIAVPKLLSKAPKPSILTTLGAAEEKLRTFLGVQAEVAKNHERQHATFNGHYNSVSVQATQVYGSWYATHLKTGLPTGTPLEGFKALS